MKTIDFIADIHGRFSKLQHLFSRLGYQRDGDCFVPPAGCTAVFLGDYIDPKSGYAEPNGIQSTLRAIKGMVDRGVAFALAGNHELNALCYHTPNGQGGWLRKHSPNNFHQHEGTLSEFMDHEEPTSEWRSVWMPWFQSLPLWLDFGNVRAVHACWHDAQMAHISDRRLSDLDLLRASHLERPKEHPDGLALETLLKGIEASLPTGMTYPDLNGIPRTHFRVRWWHADSPSLPTCADLVFPPRSGLPDSPPFLSGHEKLPGYPVSAPPVFIGHYLKPSDAPLEPERPNLACLDYGATGDGPLVAYRWKGEASLKRDSYVTSED